MRARIKKYCLFCEGSLRLDWKDAQTLTKYTTERGKIISRARNGNCAYHQRKLTVAVKRARHVALLPFVTRL